MKKITILDSTLRDGAQAEGISFSVQDKINIVKALDELGVDYIEAGNPASNPKDIEFFEKIKAVKLNKAKLTAFGSTRRKDTEISEDKGVQALIGAGTAAVAIFGKAWNFHVTEILKATLQENLSMIEDTVKYLKAHGKEVIFDAEHFFDGYKSDKKYALSALTTAEKAGADIICLCDTNGGTFSDEIVEIVKEVKKKIKVSVGIHTHDDTGMAVASSCEAVFVGASHVQGTLLGFGERCGNANLSAIIANLQIKKGYDLIEESELNSLTQICRRIGEIANISVSRSMPYIGKSAFAHKAGMHIDGVNKSSKSFEHVSPELIGNERRFLMSEVAGRSTILDRIHKINKDIDKDSPVTQKIIEKIKEMEYKGYQFEGADASFELLIRKQLGTYKPFFSIEKFKTIGEQLVGEDFAPATAIVKVIAGGKSEISGAEGNGPVNALDIALRKALINFYPSLNEFKLTDYKVRILDSRETSSAVTRVLIESSDKKDTFVTVGVSRDIIEASLIALTDALEYKLIKDGENSIKEN